MRVAKDWFSAKMSVAFFFGESPPSDVNSTRFVQEESGLTTVHEEDEAYGVLTLTVFNIVPFRSYTLRPTLLSLLETFCELLFRDV